MKEEINPLTLDNIGEGVAGELFQRELEKVLDNILDINTDPKKTRSITLKITIKPNEDRNLGNIFIDASSTLASNNGYASQVFMGRDNGQPVCIEHRRPKQLALFEEQGIQGIVKEKIND